MSDWKSRCLHLICLVALAGIFLTRPELFKFRELMRGKSETMESIQVVDANSATRQPYTVAAAAKEEEEDHGVAHSPCDLMEDDYEVAMCVHTSKAPAQTVGRWSYRPDIFSKDARQKNPQFVVSAAHLQCLAQERQGNCVDTDAWRKTGTKNDLMRHNAVQRNASKPVVNSPGILQGKDPWVWEARDTPPYNARGDGSKSRISAMYGTLPMNDNYTATVDLLLNGTQRRIFFIGDSLTRQFSQTMRCELIHVLNRTEEQAGEQVQYIQVHDMRKDVKVGSANRLKIETEPTERDVVVWNVGRWVGSGQFRGVNGAEWWEDVYTENIEIALNLTFGKVPYNHIFFQTTSVRHFLNGQGDYNSPVSSAGALAPEMSANWSMFGGNHLMQPEQNLLALKILKQGLNDRKFSLLDTAPMMLPRADTTFDGGHYCLPGPHSFSSRMLYYQLQQRIN